MSFTPSRMSVHQSRMQLIRHKNPLTANHQSKITMPDAPSHQTLHKPCLSHYESLDFFKNRKTVLRPPPNSALEEFISLDDLKRFNKALDLNEWKRLPYAYREKLLSFSKCILKKD